MARKAPPNMSQAIVLLRVLLLPTLILIILAEESTAARNLQRHKFALKTIKSEDGDIIDCVDVYKQPSLEYFFSQNRTLQIFQNSSSPIKRPDSSKNLKPAQQTWQRSGRCPQGTIPIRRSTSSISDVKVQRTLGDIERAVGYGQDGGPFHGIYGDLVVYAMHVDPEEYSMSHVTIMNVADPSDPDFGKAVITNFVRAGWMVNPLIYGDNRPRLFVQYGTDNGPFAGCFNLDCPGFVQTSSKHVLGAPIEPLSVYGDPKQQYYVSVEMFLRKESRRWYLKIQYEEVGYWPMDKLFPDFENAPFVSWGGEVLNTWPNGRHTTTDMGNGHMAEEGPGRATMTKLLLILTIDDQTLAYYPDVFADRPRCYSAVSHDHTKELGFSLTFGGPGGPSCAPEL